MPVANVDFTCPQAHQAVGIEPAIGGQLAFNSRIDITADGIGSSISYLANGLMAMYRQPLPNLPSAETFSVPSVDMQAITDVDGAGVAPVSYTHLTLPTTSP